MIRQNLPLVLSLHHSRLAMPRLDYTMPDSTSAAFRSTTIAKGRLLRCLLIPDVTSHQSLYV